MLLLLLVAAVAVWTVETTNRERLTQRLDVMRVNTRALGRVQAEHERLTRIQPFVGEIDSLRRDRAEAASLRRELVHRQTGNDPEAQRVQAALGREVLPAELLVVHAILQRPPVAAVQVIAEQLKGFDEAVEYLALRSAGGASRVIGLRLRWAPGGWQILVPLKVVEDAGAELGGGGLLVGNEGR